VSIPNLYLVVVHEVLEGRVSQVAMPIPRPRIDEDGVLSYPLTQPLDESLYVSKSTAGCSVDDPSGIMEE